MLSRHQRITWRRNIAENFNRLSRVHERYRRQTTDRQTDDRQTDGRRQIANMNMSSRSLKIDGRGLLTSCLEPSCCDAEIQSLVCTSSLVHHPCMLLMWPKAACHRWRIIRSLKDGNSVRTWPLLVPHVNGEKPGVLRHQLSTMHECQSVYILEP